MSGAVIAKTMQGLHPLDDVVWSALTGKQSRFALGNERALRFPAAVAPFAAMADTDPASFDALRGLIEAQGPAALVTPHEVPVPGGFSVTRHERMLQMVWQGQAVPADAQQAAPPPQSIVLERKTPWLAIIVVTGLVVLILILVCMAAWPTAHGIFVFGDDYGMVTHTITTTEETHNVEGDLRRHFEGQQPYVIDPHDGDKVWLNSGDDMYEDGAGKIWRLT